LDITPTGISNGKFVLADVLCARSSDFGRNDATFVTRTHLGHILKPGDTAMGYDLGTANFNDSDIVSARGRQIPDVTLIRKSFPERRKKMKPRHWKLQTLEKDIDVDEPFRKGQREREIQEYEQFLRDVEEDTEMRSQINLFKEPLAKQILEHNRQEENDMINEEDFPEIGLEELLEDLSINDESNQ